MPRGPTLSPDERFFISQLGPDLNVTGWSLRLEEDKEFRENRVSDDSPSPSYIFRDYVYACRGLKLVSAQIDL